MNATFKALGGAIASFAPTLASMLGGPLAGTAVSALESALGLAPGSGADAITKVIQTGAMTPEQIGAIRAADQHHAEVMGQQGIDVQKLNQDFAAHMLDSDVADRSSARLRESNVHDSTPKILAYVVTLLVIVAEGSMFFTGQPQGVDGVVLGRILGTLDSAIIMVLTYYFGSSSGAARGQELLAQSNPTGAPIAITSK